MAQRAGNGRRSTLQHFSGAFSNTEWSLAYDLVLTGRHFVTYSSIDVDAINSLDYARTEVKSKQFLCAVEEQWNGATVSMTTLSDK